MRQATLASMPRYMRNMAGFRQSPAETGHRSVPLQRRLLQRIAPSTLPVLEPHWRNIPPVSPGVLTPAQARERYGYDRPRDAHREFRARQAARVFDEHQAPSDEGLEESQAVLRSLA